MSAPEAPSTIDDAEVARLRGIADEWWDPRGKMAMLHKFNPVRLGYIRDAACRQFERNAKHLDCLKGLRILDIGCGGGILSEPLARLGANVVGADPAADNIAAAQRHADRGRRACRLYAPPPPRRWRMPANASTSCWRWKWSSMSPISACSCNAAPRW